MPLELTEDSEGLLPRLMKNRFFLLGVAPSLLYTLYRFSPCYEYLFDLSILFEGSVLSHADFWKIFMFPIGIGFSFLMPAQISFSIWFFFLFTRFECLTACLVGRPLEGGKWGAFMQWQEAGAFVVFAVAMLWMARRHIWNVARKAVGFGRDVDDGDEPVRYGVTFWGLVFSLAGLVGWFCYFKMSLLMAVLLLGLILSILLVHARLVTQGGLFFTNQIWAPPQILRGISGGYGFSAPAAVVAQMQHAMLIYDSSASLSPHAMNALRISSVFKSYRRWFLPALLSALAVALLFGGWAGIHLYYSRGAANFHDQWTTKVMMLRTFADAERMVAQPEVSAETHYGALAVGSVLMVILMVLRSLFHWWPIPPLGFLVASSFAVHTMWFSFFLGWLAKVSVVLFGGGRVLRRARSFFIGLIVAEAFTVGVFAVLGLILGGPVAVYKFLPN